MGDRIDALMMIVVRRVLQVEADVLVYGMIDEEAIE
jgi:hypothetical protein